MISTKLLKLPPKSLRISKTNWTHKLIVPRVGIWVHFLGLIFMTGCISAQKPMYLAPSFKLFDIQTITILPVLDSRAKGGTEIEQFELQEVVNPIVEADLKKKGYDIEYSNEFGGDQCLATDDSMNLATECIRSLGPQNSTWVLVIFLEDFQRRKAFGSGVTVRMSGVLLDKSQGLALWRDQTHAGRGRGGLVGMAMDGLLDKEVMQECTRNLFSSLPPSKSRHSE